MYDFLVVGGGIAGLAIAELLQRSGTSVLLVEKGTRLCVEAAAEQHGWFHTGALYEALPTRVFLDALRRNLASLAEHYSCFPSMNLSTDGGLADPASPGWFLDRELVFLYSDIASLPWRWKLPWLLALKRLEERRKLGADRGRPSATAGRPRAAPGRRPRDRDLPAPAGGVERLRGVRSRQGMNLRDVRLWCTSGDRVMNSTWIASDLVGSLLAHGGRVEVSTEAERSVRGWLLTPEGGDQRPVSARNVIVSIGRWTPSFDPAARVVASPILVAHPALSDVSFAFMSPQLDRTMTHIRHQVDGMDYSVVGNATYYPADEHLDGRAGQARQQMLQRASELFGGVPDRAVGFYFGHKTEAPDRGRLRNYLSYVSDRDGYTIALPGKFSLCFSLAVTVCRHFGVTPSRSCVAFSGASFRDRVAEPRHLQIVREIQDPRSST